MMKFPIVLHKSRRKRNDYKGIRQHCLEGCVTPRFVGHSDTAMSQALLGIKNSLAGERHHKFTRPNTNTQAHSKAIS
jgi:hypothetical protein